MKHSIHVDCMDRASTLVSPNVLQRSRCGFVFLRGSNSGRQRREIRCGPRSSYGKREIRNGDGHNLDEPERTCHPAKASIDLPPTGQPIAGGPLPVRIKRCRKSGMLHISPNSTPLDGRQNSRQRDATNVNTVNLASGGTGVSFSNVLQQK